MDCNYSFSGVVAQELCNSLYGVGAINFLGDECFLLGIGTEFAHIW